MSNYSVWRDRYWSDISNQLLRLNIIDETNFDGPLLKKDTTNGAWVWSWLGRVYTQHSDTARETASIEVVPPGPGSGPDFTLVLEVMVRRHQTRQVVTFPAAFGVVGTVPASEAAGPEGATSGPEASGSSEPGPSPSGPSASGGNQGL